jgi:hypothetical protein
MNELTHEEWQRYLTGEEPLTEEMIEDGWHFCPHWDDLLIGPGMGESLHCECESGVNNNDNTLDHYDNGRLCRLD